LLQALKGGEVVTLDVGAIDVQDQGANRQDMEHQVIVRRGAEKVAKAGSTPSFAQQAATDRGGKRRARRGRTNSRRAASKKLCYQFTPPRQESVERGISAHQIQTQTLTLI